MIVCRLDNSLATFILTLYVLNALLRYADAVHGHAYVRRDSAIVRQQQDAMEEEEEEVEDELEDDEDYKADEERQITEILSSADDTSHNIRGDPIDVGKGNTNLINDQREEYSLTDDKANSNNSSDVTARYHQSERHHNTNYNFHHQHHYDGAEHARHGSRTIATNAIDKESVFEQGETRDFLRFLRRIQYDHRQCPFNEESGDEPVVVSVSVVVSNVRAVSEVTMDYSLEMFYRESWQDKRLIYEKRKFKNKTELALHESYANFLWHPDTFMPNAIASKNPRKQSVSHRSLLRLQSDGNVLYSRRLSVVAECPMDLTLVCKLGIESYGYTADQVIYGWSHGKREALTLQKIRLPDFRIKEAFVTNQVENYATGNYSRLYICFVFTRSAGFCFLQLIIPSTAVVITSWVSMWMENETSFQDMISIILTILLLTFSYNEVMPRVSYLKALDIWLAVCFMVVFLSLIKLAVCKYIRQRLQITQDTSIVADMIPLVRVAAASGLQFQRQSSQYALTRQNSCWSPATATNAQPQRIRPSTIQNNQTRNENILLARNPSVQTTQPAAQPNCDTASIKRQTSLARNVSAQSNRAVVGSDSRRKRRPPTPPSAVAPQQRVSRLANTLDNNNNPESVDSHELHDLRVRSSANYDHVSNTQYRSRSREKPPIQNYGAIGAAIEHLGGIGQIIIHQALSKANSPTSYPPVGSPLLDAETLSRIAQSRNMLFQLQQKRAHEQQELQARIETQLLQAQAQLYMRQKDEEQRRLRKKRKSRREIEAMRQNRAAAFNAAAAINNELELNESAPCDYYDTVEGGGAGDAPRDFSINFSDVDSTGGGLSDAKWRLLNCMDHIGNIEFSAQFLNRFHWISQMTFFFCFVIFCFFFFLVYPNIRVPIVDPACVREQAEWFAAL